MSRGAMTRRAGTIAGDCPPPCRRIAGRSVERRGEPPARLADQRIGGAAAIELADDQQPHVVLRECRQQKLEGLLVIAGVERGDRLRARSGLTEADPRPQTVGLEAVLD